MTKNERASAMGMISDPRVLALSSTSLAGTLGLGLIAPALPVIATAFGVSDARVGLVMTMYSLPALLTIPLLSVLADIYGRRPIFLLVVLVFGVAGTMIAFTTTFTNVLLLRVVQGAFGAVIISLTITILGDLYSGPAGTTAQGIRLSANGLSRILIPPLAGFLAVIAWYMPFLVYALVIPVVIFVYLVIPETIERASANVDFVDEVRRYPRAIRDEFSDKDLGIIALGFLFQGFGWVALLTFIPLFAVRELNVSPTVAGLVLSIVGVVRIIIAPLTGHVLMFVSRKQALVAGLFLSACGAAFISFVQSALWLGILVAIFSVGDALFTPIHRDTLTSLTRVTTRAGTVGSGSIFRKIGTTTSPVVFGAVLAFSDYGPVFAGASIVFLVYGLGIWFLYSGQ